MFGLLGVLLVAEGAIVLDVLTGVAEFPYIVVGEASDIRGYSFELFFSLLGKANHKAMHDVRQRILFLLISHKVHLYCW
jgi:hypothetical protein